MPTAQVRPRALRPWRKAAPIPYPASARARPKRTPAATTRSISARAISVLARTRRCSSGTPASAQRSGSLAHSSGRNNLSPSGTGTSSWARVSETRTWQFACLPRAPQYWRATPTERRPFLGKAVSSITSTALGPPTRASAFPARTARKGASSQAGLAMKCCSWSCPPSPRRTASGCRLLRPSGPSKPCRYKGAQRRRVLRPITSKNGASQVSRAASTSDDPGSTTPYLLGCCDPRGDGTVGKWRERFAKDRLEGLRDQPRSGAPRTVTDKRVAGLLVRTLEAAPEDATHWSTRAMAAACGLSAATVQRVWRAFGLKPHRTESFKLSSDPEFAAKVRDIVGLYLSPPD